MRAAGTEVFSRPVTPNSSAGLDPVGHVGKWTDHAACREADAPSMFADQWGVGGDARRCRTAALATCRTCVVRRQCGVTALAQVDAGMSLYGVVCGIEFTDVLPSRQSHDVARLRAVVAKLDQSAAADLHPGADTGARPKAAERLLATLTPATP
jgi:hypothetical protein